VTTQKPLISSQSWGVFNMLYMLSSGDANSIFSDRADYHIVILFEFLKQQIRPFASGLGWL
jgi:hypothetical protein